MVALITRLVAAILLLAVVSTDPTADDILNNVTFFHAFNDAADVNDTTTVLSTPAASAAANTTTTVVSSTVTSDKATTHFDKLGKPPKNSGFSRNSVRPPVKAKPNKEESSAYLLFIIGVPILVFVLISIGIVVYCFAKHNPTRKPATPPTPRENGRNFDKTVRYQPISPESRTQPESSKAPLSSHGSSEILPLPGEPAPGGPDLSPINIPANKFNYKGPLIIDKRGSADLLDKTHLLDDPKLNARTPKESDHIRFDDRLNEIYEIGSEVEVVIGADGKPKSAPRPQLPKSEDNTENSWRIFVGERKAKTEQKSLEADGSKEKETTKSMEKTKSEGN